MELIQVQGPNIKSIRQMQQTPQKNTSQQPKPENMLLLQASMLESRIFPIHSLQDALEKMIMIYSESMTLKNVSNPEVKDSVRFTLKSMVEYYSSMENIMYMEKDTQNGTKEKHKVSMQTFDKEFVIASLRTHCIKKSSEKSVELAKLIYKNGQNLEDILRNMGFAV